MKYTSELSSICQPIPSSPISSLLMLSPIPHIQLPKESTHLQMQSGYGFGMPYSLYLSFCISTLHCSLLCC